MSRVISRWRPMIAVGVVLLALVAGSPAHAQGIVQGRVVDGQGQPVAGATITVTTEESSRKFQLKTDGKGEYFQIGIPSGRYTVTADNGKFKASNPVQVSAGRPARADFTLAPTAGAGPDAATAALQKLIEDAAAASKTGDHQAAIAKYTEVAATIPNCAECYDNIGREHLAMKNYDQAEAAFKQAIALKPDSPDPYNGLANVYNAQRKFDLAAEASAQATELSAAGAAASPGAAGGGSADALYNQGVVAWNAGRTDEARGHFEAALKADPNHAPAHFQLGMALVNGGALPQAKSEFETYLKLAPDGQFAAQAKAMIGAIP